MKTAIILCSLGAVATAAISLNLVMPDDAQQRYYRAHNEVEQIASRKESTPELKRAVMLERAAEKDLYVVRDLGRRMIWVSAGFSSAAVALSLLSLKKKNARPDNTSEA